jgi:hypothetical protein
MLPAMNEPVALDVAAPATPRREGWLALSAWSIVAAFGTYFCMYAFRRPFAAAAYDPATFGDLGGKSALVIAQVLGYTLSKFIGITFIAGLRPERRAAWILILIASAEAALLLFALLPPRWGWLCLFLNGLPLGMVFGLVLGFLEGRRLTEALTAGLCVSFIVADGVTRSVGAALLEAGVTEHWMPFVAGLLFAVPLMICVWMLTRIPAPTRADVAARCPRAPLDRAERRRFLRRYAGGLAALVFAYLLITVLRSLRADFALELWTALGTRPEATVFARSELLVGSAVIVLNGLVVLVPGNGRAFSVAMGLSIAGVLVIGVTLALGVGASSPFAFMVLIGLGLYLPYVAVHTTLFERLIAMTRDRGNLGYLMYLADAAGYLGYAGVVLARQAWLARQASDAPADVDFLGFFCTTSAVIAGAALLLLLYCWRYFIRHPATSAAF